MTPIAFALLAAVALPLAPPVQEGCWVRPDPTAEAAEPVWGHRDGLRLGLPHRYRPPGILRVFHPRITGDPYTPINYIAVEPVVGGVRGYSELEKSSLDQKQGKRIWSGDEVSLTPADPVTSPARGMVRRDGGVETLQVYFMVEPFGNGARTYLRATFRSDRVDEVDLQAFSADNGATMSSCILTATMGNFTRLRKLQLARDVVDSRDLWPKFGVRGFAPPVEYGADRMMRDHGGNLLVTASPDKDEQWLNWETTPDGWRYYGKRATHYWRIPRDEATSGARVRVNGRVTYYGTSAPIPGGIAYENFEVERPFAQGQRSTFGVTTAAVGRLLEEQ